MGIHLGVGIVSAIINATIGAIILLLIVRLVAVGGVDGHDERLGTIAVELLTPTIKGKSADPTGYTPAYWAGPDNKRGSPKIILVQLWLSGCVVFQHTLIGRPSIFMPGRLDV